MGSGRERGTGREWKEIYRYTYKIDTKRIGGYRT